MEMFAQATKIGLRFDTPKGKLDVEQLWDLDVAGKSQTTLENIGRSLQEELNGMSSTGSFFGAASVTKAQERAKKTLELKINIVKFIGEHKLKAAAKAEERRKAAESRQRILELMSEKQDEELKGKSLADLQALLAQTGADVSDDEDE